MKTRLIAVLAAALGLAAFASPAFAQNGPSFDLSGGWTRLSTDDVDLDAISIRGTLHVNEYFGGEVEGQFGVGDDNVGAIDVELDNAFGVFARGDLPLMDTGTVFARIGYFDAEVSASAPGVAASLSGDGWAGGVGGELFFLGNGGVRADYLHYDFDGDDGDGFSLSYVHRFGR